MSWSTSDRRQRLPADWPKRRKRILKRDGYRCTWTEQGQRCTARATDVDHVDRHGPDDEWNLRSLCREHHARKTSAEGRAAMKQRKRPTAEAHPGVRMGGGCPL